MTLVSSVWREVTQKLGLLKALIGFCTIAGEESKRKAEPRTRSASRLSLSSAHGKDISAFSRVGGVPWQSVP